MRKLFSIGVFFFAVIFSGQGLGFIGFRVGYQFKLN